MGVQVQRPDHGSPLLENLLKHRVKCAEVHMHTPAKSFPMFITSRDRTRGGG